MKSWFGQVEVFIEIFGESDSPAALIAEPDAEFVRFVLAQRASELPKELVSALQKIASSHGVTL